MVFGQWETCAALIDAGADPKKFMANGMDALFSACCKGNLPNIRAWLTRFPSWEIGRTEPGMGLNATCLSSLVGSAEVCAVLQTLVEAKADVSSPKFWGGEESMLCLLASNENVNNDAAHFLLSQGCKVNGCWRPQKLPLGAILKAMRFAGRFPHGTAVDEFAVLEKSTPLHFAAKRGDVELINLLMASRAEPTKNKQGNTPLDVAGTFFGGSVPELLRASLSGERMPASGTPAAALPKLLGGIEHKDVKAAEKGAKDHPRVEAVEVAEREWRVSV
uniref:Uncharacterized protein n=1 Tax=Alexandrium catenella TaxID=2925 RepID=A0A7S1LZR5_ALECA